MSAYSELYLQDAMDNMGEMMEYASTACGLDMSDFFMRFRISGIADAWEQGDPRYIAGMSGTELARLVLEKTSQSHGSYPPALRYYDTGEEYWCGWILAYLQWRLAMPFAAILDVTNFDDFLRIYPAMHTASEERCVAYILERMHQERRVTRLQMYRQALGLTQRELSELSSVNLRTLQQYEAGSKDIRKASVINVISLARELGVKPEDLVAP